MKIKLLELSKEEQDLVEKAPQEYGPAFVNAHDLVFLTWTFVNTKKPEAYAFMLFLSQIQKSLVLCLLSAVRNHEVQFNMMLRFALENASLASYSLFKPETNNFYKTDENGIMFPKESANLKAYKWLDKNYTEHSQKIKSMKDNINESFAHASILPAPQNIDYGSPQITNMFFDYPDKLFVIKNLWWVANVALGMLDLFAKVIRQYPLVTIADDFVQSLENYATENYRILNELKRNPRFAKWL
ncbi:MAG TPA: hypothetical protein VMW78_01785 [Anaerolineae bacterium]|nr:hypothetical protein [Anaerolineae bacterium]